jgi:dsDNA-specific endonuclease/ATPase MutS2
MAIQKKRAARRIAPRQEFNPRDLLLAGVGAVSLGRKQAIRSIEEAGDNAAALRKQVDASVKSLEARARAFTRQAEGEFTRLGKQAKARVARLRKQAQAAATQLRKQASLQVAPLQRKLDEVVVEVANRAEARLGPVLAKISGRKPARRKAPARKAARQAA